MASKNQQTTNSASQDQEGQSNRPDFYVKQFRPIRTEDGIKTRTESIGAAWLNAATGAITVRLSGVQMIQSDFFLFPAGADKEPG